MEKNLGIEYSLAKVSEFGEHISASLAVQWGVWLKVELPSPHHLPCLRGILFYRPVVGPR